MQKLIGKKIAVLVENGFGKTELDQTKKALEKEGANPYIISPQMGRAKSWFKEDWDSIVKVDMNITHAEPEFYDALFLPGGIISSDKMRDNEAAIKFAKHYLESKKPIGAIGYGLWPLIETGMMKGFTVTSSPSIKTDIINAGNNWVNKNVVADANLITGRGLDDLGIFIAEFIDFLAREKN